MLDNMIYDRTAEDVANKTDKGLYRHTDLNRVKDAARRIFFRYKNDAGYNFQGYLIFTDYPENYIPRANEMRFFLLSVLSLRGHIAMPDSYRLPSSMDGLDYKGANAIEKFLYDSDLMLDNMDAAWWYADEVFSGEVDQ